MADSTGEKPKERFAPKQPVQLAPPKDDIITFERLSQCNGTNEKGENDEDTNPGLLVYVAIKGVVFDVTGKETYQPGNSYNVFAGKEPNRALGLSSLKPEDCVSDYSTLSDKERQTLDDWYTFFSKRYNIVGRLPTNSFYSTQ